MLGSGFIGRFYTDSLHGYRNKDRVVSVYSRSEESVKKFAQDYKVPHYTNNMEESVSNKDVDVVCITIVVVVIPVGCISTFPVSRILFNRSPFWC